MEESLDIVIQHASLENENENSEIHQEANTSSGNETQIEGLVNDITTVFASSQPPFSITGSIGVPDHLRKVDKEAYNPRVISIGPIHHSNAKLQPMEKCKVRYVEYFINTRANVNLKNLVSAVKEMEKEIRYCYADTILSSTSSDVFVKMILIDAIFILELFFRFAEASWEKDDAILAEPWLLTFLRIDLMLLENQLPFFVLKELFDRSFTDGSNSFSLWELSYFFFHLYNFSIKFCQPHKFKQVPVPPMNVNVKILHLTALIRTFFLRSSLPRRDREVTKLLYTATQLQEAGVKFNISSENSVLEIKFDVKNGVLEMPCFRIHEETVILVRNLIALEQSRYIFDAYITDYFVLLNFLIKTTKDMDLLCENRILANYLSDSDTATTAFKGLNNNLMWSFMNSDYVKTCEDLNDYYKNSCHRWKATLRDQYFSTPWRTASTIAAIILLVLTFIQTVYSII